MLISGKSNSPRFSSGGAQAASNLYYLNWLEKQKKEQQSLPTQPTNTGACPQLLSPVQQDCFQPKAPGVRFGVADPLSWSWLGLTALGHGVTKGIDWLIKAVSDSPAQLQDDTHFKQAKSFLKIAQSVHASDKREYMEKAEFSFIKAAEANRHQIHQADCYKFAAICAKAVNKHPQTVKALADLAHEKYIAAGGNVNSSSVAREINNSEVPEICRKLTNQQYRKLPHQEYREPQTGSDSNHRMGGGMAMTGSAYDAGCVIL